MAFSFWAILAVISRFVVGIITLGLMVFFAKRFKTSKKQGPSPNYYFGGLTCFFGVVGLILFVIGIQDFLQYADILFIDLEGAFPNYDFKERRYSFGFLSELVFNLVRPVYVALTIIAITVFMIQIFPLEKVLERKKIGMAILLSADIACLLIYIPPLYLTPYAFIALAYGFLSLFFAFLTNFYLTGLIIKKSAGAVKKRAIMNISGFFLFLIGLIWSMRVGWSKAICSGFDLNTDVFFGDLLILIASLIYFQAFRTD